MFDKELAGFQGMYRHWRGVGGVGEDFTLLVFCAFFCFL